MGLLLIAGILLEVLTSMRENPLPKWKLSTISILFRFVNVVSSFALGPKAVISSSGIDTTYLVKYTSLSSRYSKTLFLRVVFSKEIR